MLLPPELFTVHSARTESVDSIGDQDLVRKLKDVTALNDQVALALDQIKKAGPRSLLKGLEDWNFEEGLIFRKGKIYVPQNSDLRREVVKTCHDPISIGHSGEIKTLELVQRNFWWPGMTVFIRDYVQGCAMCQTTKNITHPTRVPLQPNKVPSKPWHTITTDFITDLPESQGFDSINVVVDQFTKMVVFTPCNKTIDADDTADLLINNMYQQFGLWERMISNCGPQFVSKTFQAIWNKLGVKSDLSSTYHHQTDGETERVNQELEQYL